MKPGLPSLKEMSKLNKMKFAEWYVKYRNYTETDELSYEFSNKIEKKITSNSGLELNTFFCYHGRKEYKIDLNYACIVNHFTCPKISNNSLVRDQKSNKHIANGYKNLVHTFKREAVQFLVAKNVAVNHLPLEALPAVQTWTANCKRDRKAVVTWHFAVCGLQFPMKNLMLKVSIM